MGKSVNNEYSEGFSGKIGRNMVFRQLNNGEVGMTRKPRKKNDRLISNTWRHASCSNGQHYTLSKWKLIR
jgi:hypothetical protein